MYLYQILTVLADFWPNLLGKPAGLWVGFVPGRGTVRSHDTPGLPVPITSRRPACFALVVTVVITKQCCEFYEIKIHLSMMADLQLGQVTYLLLSWPIYVASFLMPSSALLPSYLSRHIGAHDVFAKHSHPTGRNILYAYHWEPGWRYSCNMLMRAVCAGFELENWKIQ
jgi:hypothetical protein